MRHKMKHQNIAILFLIICCGPTNKSIGQTKSPHAVSSHKTKESSVTNKLSNKKVKILWRANKYNEELKDTFNSIFINENFCKTITDPERAALGYVATFVGNECWWDGETKDDRSNLKCKLLTAKGGKGRWIK